MAWRWIDGIANFHPAFYRVDRVRYVNNGTISGNGNIVADADTAMANYVYILLNVYIVTDAKPRQRVLAVHHYFYAATMPNDRAATDSDAMRKSDHVLVKNGATFANSAIVSCKNKRSIDSAYTKMKVLSQLNGPGNAPGKAFGGRSISHALRPTCPL
ncbi:hypothetical protein ACWGK7_19020 (plasmid) [Sphingomonas aurantiaca]